MTRVDDHAAWYEETVRRIAAAVKAIGLQCGPEDNLDEQLENYVRSEVENYRSVATHFYGHGLEDAAANKPEPQPEPTGLQAKPCRWYVIPGKCDSLRRWFNECPHPAGLASSNSCCYYE